MPGWETELVPFLQAGDKAVPVQGVDNLALKQRKAAEEDGLFITKNWTTSRQTQNHVPLIPTCPQFLNSMGAFFRVAWRAPPPPQLKEVFAPNTRAGGYGAITEGRRGDIRSRKSRSGGPLLRR